MVRPTVSIAARRPVRLPGEPAELVLTLRNPGAESLLLPLPAPEWWRAARFRLERPDGSAAVFRPADAAEPAEGERLTVFDGAELETSFSLDGRVERVDEPGWYSIEGVLSSAVGDWPIAGARWFVEASPPMEAAVPADPGATGEEALPCWTLVRGARRSALSLHALVASDPSRRERLELSPATLLGDVAAGAHGLVVVEPPAAPAARWAAWLTPGTLHAGVPFALFETTSFALPGEAARILPRLLAAPGGGADAVICAASRRELWQVRLHAPEWTDPPAPPPGDDDYVPHPAERVRIPAPELAASYATPVEIDRAAASRGGPGFGTTAAAATARSGASVEVHYALLPAGGAPARWSSVRIDRAELIPGTDPALVIDDRGIGRVAVLYRADETERRLGVAVVAFDPDGQALWTTGTGTTHFPLPEAEPVAAAAALRLDAETGAWRCDWSVLLADGTCLIRRGWQQPVRVSPPGRVLEPLAMVASRDVCAVACRSEAGLLCFAAA